MHGCTNPMATYDVTRLMFWHNIISIINFDVVDNHDNFFNSSCIVSFIV
jgi:hypothetical protein